MNQLPRIRWLVLNRAGHTFIGHTLMFHSLRLWVWRHTNNLYWDSKKYLEQKDFFIFRDLWIYETIFFLYLNLFICFFTESLLPKTIIFSFSFNLARGNNLKQSWIGQANKKISNQVLMFGFGQNFIDLRIWRSFKRWTVVFAHKKPLGTIIQSNKSIVTGQCVNGQLARGYHKSSNGLSVV